MLLTGVAVAGVVTGTLGTGVKIYRENKKKQEMPWTYRASKMGLTRKRKKKHSLFQAGRGKEAAKRWTFDAIAPKTSLSGLLFGDVRDEQMKALSTPTDSEKMNEEEREANRCLMAAVVSLGFATTGMLFYPPLVLIL